MPSCWTRKIIHIDMDAFFAAIEQRDHPELRGRPVVVGGDPCGRGVVSTASYEARAFGIHSAMPAAQARRLCPEAVFLRPDIEKYQRVSNIIMSILRQHTPLVEVVSLDEAYLDVTSHRFGIDDPVLVAKLIKQNVRAVTQLTASAGVAENLFLAKVASDFQKPDGLTVIAPGTARQFLQPLPVRKIPGVGPVTEKTLHRLKIFTCGDLAATPLPVLRHHFGRTGVFLHERACGRDDRGVEPETEPKQYSMEETFPQDTRNVEWLERKLKRYAKEIYEGLSTAGRMGRTVVLKVKYHDFELITRSRTLDHDPDDAEEVYRIAVQLLREKTEAGRKPIRLLGLGISGLHLYDPSSELATRDLFTL